MLVKNIASEDQYRSRKSIALLTIGGNNFAGIKRKGKMYWWFL